MDSLTHQIPLTSFQRLGTLSFQGLKQNSAKNPFHLLLQLKAFVQTLTAEIASVRKENKHVKDTVIDLKALSEWVHLFSTSVLKALDYSPFKPENRLNSLQQVTSGAKYDQVTPGPRYQLHFCVCMCLFAYIFEKYNMFPYPCP